MRRLIVDGYNVIGAEEKYRRLASADVDAARARLVEDVAPLVSEDRHVIVVFDGAGNPSSDGTPHHVAGVTVIFSRAGQRADTLIEALARRFKERAEETLVVTSDAQTQWAVMGGPVTRMSSAEFVNELLEEAECRRGGFESGARRSRLEERIDPGVRAVLSRWARGL
ncbi:MAG: NYN domain-containing protein [Coriobacteriales bacterium]